MRKYEEVPIDQLKPYKKNARTHSDSQVQKIANSIEEFGFINPVLIDGDFNIIAGHGRLLGAKKLGLKSVPCLFVEDLTEAQQRAYVLADNKLAEDAGWDMDLLQEELKALADMDFDITLAGFELDDLNIEIDEPVDNDEAPGIDEEAEPIVHSGELWKLGDHYLLCGDSTSKEDVQKLMQGGEVDLLLTDPPYNVAYEGKTADALTIQNDSMESDEFKKFLVSAFSCAESVMKAGASFYVWYASREHVNFETALTEVNLEVREQLIWNKNVMVLGRQDYQWKHEPCLYGWKGGAGHNWYSDRSQTTVLDFDKPARSDIHPTMKPVDLFAYLIKNSSKRGDKVLDLFGGSGTTLIACDELGRQAYLMELDPKYASAIVTRWENLTGKKAERVEG